MGCLTSNRTFEFEADPDDDANPGIFNGFLPLQDRANWKKFSGSATLTEFYDFRVLLFLLQG